MTEKQVQILLYKHAKTNIICSSFTLKINAIQSQYRHICKGFLYYICLIEVSYVVIKLKYSLQNRSLHFCYVIYIYIFHFYFLCALLFIEIEAITFSLFYSLKSLAKHLKCYACISAFLRRISHVSAHGITYENILLQVRIRPKP